MIFRQAVRLEPDVVIKWSDCQRYRIVAIRRECNVVLELRPVGFPCSTVPQRSFGLYAEMLALTATIVGETRSDTVIRTLLLDDLVEVDV